MANKFAEAVSVTDKHVVLGVLSRSTEKSLEFANRHSLLFASNVMEDFFNNDQIHAVYIATPHTTHFEYSKKSLEFGKSTLCEKPLFFTKVEYDEIGKLVESKKCLLMESLGFVFNPNFQRLKEIVQSEQIGDVIGGTATFTKKIDLGMRNRLVMSELGGGALNEMGSYPIGLACQLFGDPKSVDVHNFFIKDGVDLMIEATINFKSGSKFHFICDFTKAGESVAEIQGTKGKIRISNPYYLFDSVNLTVNGSTSLVSARSQNSSYNNLPYVLVHFENLHRTHQRNSYMFGLKILEELMKHFDRLS